MPHIFKFPTQAQAYLMTALTHVHAGSGDSGYGVVDKTIQRDPVSDLPTVHASSLKGAFREAFEQLLAKPLGVEHGKATVTDHPLIAHIFGSSIGSTRNKEQEDENRYAGSCRFHEALLLSLPVRSNVQPYFCATSPYLVESLRARIDTLGLVLDEQTEAALTQLQSLEPEPGKPFVFDKADGVYLEEFLAVPVKRDGLEEGHLRLLQAIFGPRIAYFHHDDFKLLSSSLPVIARNYLENGISRNLWYEEILPRESRLLFTVQTAPYGGEVAPNEAADFDSLLMQLKGRVQVGANASVGYGLCHFSSFPGILSA